MTSSAACPVFSMPALWRWTDYNNYIIGAFLIVMGACLIQFGGKYDVASVCLVASFGKFVVIMLFLYGFVLPDITPHFMVWISVLMSMVIAAGAGFGVYLQPKAGVVSIGLVLGALFGSIFYIIFLSNMTDEQNEVLDKFKADPDGLRKATHDIQVEEWTQLAICMATTGIVFAVASVIFFQAAVICGTCAIGSYLFVRGLTLCLGGYPNEFLIYNSIRNKRLLQQENMMFVWIIAMVILCIFSVQRQWMLRTQILSANDYKKYDFKYRKPTGAPGTDGGSVVRSQAYRGVQKYNLLAEDQSKYEVVRDSEPIDNEEVEDRR